MIEPDDDVIVPLQAPVELLKKEWKLQKRELPVMIGSSALMSYRWSR